MSRRWRVFFRNKTAIFGGGIVLLMLVAAVGADWIAPYDPDARHEGAFREPPSAQHWLGTDDNGFDVFSRVVHGARSSLLVAFAAVGFALFFGVPLGLWAGWRGGWIDGTCRYGSQGIASQGS